LLVSLSLLMQTECARGTRTGGQYLWNMAGAGERPVGFLLLSRLAQPPLLAPDS
jgi:hypothetical protein